MKSIYDSPYHHPLLAYVGGLLLLFAIARRLPFLYAYLVVFLVTILADATATGGWSPVPLGTGAYTAFSVLFIVLGDLRYFVIVERWAKPEASLDSVLLVSTATSLIVPVTTGVMTKLIPAMQDDRVLYVVYESAMVFLTLGYARLRARGSILDDETQRAIRWTSRFFATLYAGWALCDVAILADVEIAHVARIVPNVLYYAGFLAVVFVSAPERERRLAV